MQMTTKFAKTFFLQISKYKLLLCYKAWPWMQRNPADEKRLLHFTLEGPQLVLKRGSGSKFQTLCADYDRHCLQNMVICV